MWASLSLELAGVQGAEPQLVLAGPVGRHSVVADGPQATTIRLIFCEDNRQTKTSVVVPSVKLCRV